MAQRFGAFADATELLRRVGTAHAAERERIAHAFCACAFAHPTAAAGTQTYVAKRKCMTSPSATT
jgi:hypothetical protein